MTELHVDEIRDAGSLPPLEHEWRGLVSRLPGGDIFQTWEWVSTWVSSFWADRLLAILLVRRGEELVGIVPLVHDVDGVLGCRDVLALPVNPHVRRMDVISSTSTAEVLGAALGHLRRTRGRVRVALRQCRADAPGASALPAAAAAHGLASRSMVALPSPLVRIDTGWDDYLATRPPRARREILRKVRNAERRGGLTWAALSHDGDRALEAILDIERRSWKEQARTAITSEAALTRFYTRLCEAFTAAGWFRAYLLFAGDVPVAHIFGAVYRRQYYAIKTSYDAAFRALSPGVVLFHHALRDAFARGLQAFDLLGDPARWKGDLANGEQRHTRLCAFSPFDAQCRWCGLRDGCLRPLARRIRDQAMWARSWSSCQLRRM